jgi:hypothetical protein
MKFEKGDGEWESDDHDDHDDDEDSDSRDEYDVEKNELQAL